MWRSAVPQLQGALVALAGMHSRNASLHLTLIVIVLGFVLDVRCFAQASSTSSSRSSGFAEEQLVCQEAVGHLIECCSGFPASEVLCDASESTTTSCAGDMSSSTPPSFSASETGCVLGEACGTLVATGVCARAQRRAAAGPDTTYEDVSPSSELDAADEKDEGDAPVLNLFDVDEGETVSPDAGGAPDAGDASPSRDAEPSVWAPVCP